jgi:hypothetical protein
MTLSNFKPFMVYLEPAQIALLKKFAKKHKKHMTQVVRESLQAKLSSGDEYSAGFNAGVNKCIDTIMENKAAQLRFPSGRSVAEMAVDDFEKVKMAEVPDETNGK